MHNEPLNQIKHEPDDDRVDQMDLFPPVTPDAPLVREELKHKVPPMSNWRTTDEDEINRRRLRALDEQPHIRNLDPGHPVFSNFEVISKRTGMKYYVEIRDLAQRVFHSTTVDFQINGLGTCKHTEAVLIHLERTQPNAFRLGLAKGSSRIDVAPDYSAGTLRVERNLNRLSPRWRELFDDDGLLVSHDPEEAVEVLRACRIRDFRLSQEIEPWLEDRRRRADRVLLRREYEELVREGRLPQHETKEPLFPYQRQGMLHLVFTERALLADEMGLGKTIQAIAACSLLHRLEKARRVLIVAPASLKTEWEEQIQQFTNLPYQIVLGPRAKRLPAYSEALFFTIANYEQILRDSLEINARLQPDVVILDEAQRIKNWSTKTAQAIKRLQSRYAFVLTGTPIQNRLDELYSLVNFIDPTLFGPLFRFNREFYILDERGRPSQYCNLEKLHERIAPIMVRRRKHDVETELPSRTDRHLFVKMSDRQTETYKDHACHVTRLLNIAKRHPLTKQQQDKLMRELCMMRMICDTNYILDSEDRVCPKLKEIELIVEEACTNPETKIVLFSEWVRMLELVRDLFTRLGIDYAWHTGSVPQQKRRAEIIRFKNDPHCRVFLSTDSGGVGLNLQAAHMVINCDQPWNPATLEQRIARVWRKKQTRNVTVIHLVTEASIEHRMLGTLKIKRNLADGVLDLQGDLEEISLIQGQQQFLARLRQVIDSPDYPTAPQAEKLPVDRAGGFAQCAADLAGDALLCCEEQFPDQADHSVLLVVMDSDATQWEQKFKDTHERYFKDRNCDGQMPVHLQVIDRDTVETLEKLQAMGLVQTTVRTARKLWPLAPDTDEAAREAKEARDREVEDLRDQTRRKVKMARVLAMSDLHEEAREALLTALLLHGRTLAREVDLPLPQNLEQALANGPITPFWGQNLTAARQFAEQPEADSWPIIEMLQQFIQTTIQ